MAEALAKIISYHLEMSHPAQFSKLCLVGVEHVKTRFMIRETELDYAALRLALHDRVNRPQCWRERRSVVIVVKEICVKVEGVDGVEFSHIHQVDADGPFLFYADRVVLVSEGNGIYGVELILIVEIGVEAVHHHHEFLPAGILLRAQLAA